MNLFHAAEQNTDAIQEKFSDLCAQQTPDNREYTERFADTVKSSQRIGVNLRPSTLAGLIHGRRYQNIYEWAEERSKLSGRPADDFLRERLGSYYSRRLSFDDTFPDGRSFHYGALNIGGVGCSYYGPFCITLSTDFAKNDCSFAYLRDDSLKAYVDAGDVVNITAIQEDAAVFGCGHYIAALKHHRDLIADKHAEWPNLVCNDSNFIEAIFVADVGLSDIDEARMLSSSYDEIWALVFYGTKPTSTSSSSQLEAEGLRSVMAHYFDILSAGIEGNLKIVRVI